MKKFIVKIYDNGEFKDVKEEPIVIEARSLKAAHKKMRNMKFCWKIGIPQGYCFERYKLEEIKNEN